MFSRTFLAGLLGALAVVTIARAHDTWIQTNAAIVRTGDAVYVDLMLGNHGNAHRDFKLAGKATLEGCTLDVIGPDGATLDLKPSLADLGYAPKEGFWQARFEPTKPGLYLVAQRSDTVASYAPERIVRSAKSFFLACPKLDAPPADAPGFDRVLGHAMELVPLSNPVAPMGPGTPIRVRLLYKGKSLAGERVSFIPRGTTLADGFDATYERLTDADGLATFEAKEAGYYLVAAHRDEPAETGEGSAQTKYAATLTVIVPAVCACCGD